MRTRTIGRAMLGAAGLLMATACTFKLSDAEKRTIDAWMSCDECINNERLAVSQIGKKAVPTLARALREGPSPARRQLMNRKFANSYARNPVTGMSSADYVSRLLSNYIATFQERAATSLADIGGTSASAALESVLGRSAIQTHREDVIRSARINLAGRRFAYRLSPAIVRVGDTVFLRATSGTPFLGDELAFLDDSAFTAESLLVFRRPDTLAFYAVGREGPHLVTLTNIGTTSNTEFAALTISSVSDRNDRRMLDCSDLACQRAKAEVISSTALPYGTFLTLVRAGRIADTLDIFRFAGAAPLAITARLLWATGGPDLDLVWRRCSDFGVVGNNDGATSHNPERTSVARPSGECWFLLVIARAGSTQPVFARLRITSP